MTILDLLLSFLCCYYSWLPWPDPNDEFCGEIYCFDCKKDTLGNGGIFDGPIPLQAAQLLGLTFDRIDLETIERLYLKKSDGKLIWEKAHNQSLELTEEGRATSDRPE